MLADRVIPAMDTSLADMVAPSAPDYLSRGIWSGLPIGAQLAEVVRRVPAKTAVVDRLGTRRVSYAELDALANRFARSLRELGVGRGDVVAVQLPNCLEFVVIALGASKVGAVINPMVPAYRAKELAFMVGLTEAKLVVTPTTYRRFDHAAMILDVAQRVETAFEHIAIDVDADVDDDRPGWIDRLEAWSDAPVEPHSDASAVAVIVFTSGTESNPKAVMQTDHLLNANVRAVWDELSMDESDIVWMPSPIGHATGFTFGVRFALVNGATLVLQDRWSGAEAVDLVETERPTFTLAATIFLQEMLNEADQRPAVDLSSLTRGFGCGGAAIPSELVRRARDRGFTVLRLYGQSETEIATTTRVTDSWQKLTETDGSPVGHTLVEIRDADDAVVGAGAEGEIFVRGPGTCAGYFKDAQRTKEKFDSGWVRTGDIGRLDEDGFLTVIGRKSEVIIRAGVNIAPREIEEEILQYPEVSEVAVIGVPDERLGELVCACVILVDEATLTLADVVERMRATGVATYKLPQRLEVLASFPMTSSGKVQRASLAGLLGQADSGPTS